VEDKLTYEDTQVTHQEYFAFKIDSVWMDLFWDFVKQKQDKNITVDQCFMNYFVYIAQMCYFKDNLDKNAEDFKNDFSVFEKKENILFLFNTLDWLHQMSIEDKQVDCKKINYFFSEIFLSGSIDEKYNNQIRLFEDGAKGINLFEKCLLEGEKFENKSRILFFAIFNYSMKYKVYKATENLKNYIRVIRNLLQATRRRRETVYELDILINNFGNYWKLFEQLANTDNVYNILKNAAELDTSKIVIKKEDIENERQKAEIVARKNERINTALFMLEEFEPFSGLIHQLKPRENEDKLIEYSQAVRDIWKQDNGDSLVIGAMIASGFDGFYTKDCNYGAMEMYFFGGHNNWNTILTGKRDDKQDRKISDSILTLLNNFLVQPNTLSPKEKLVNIKTTYLNNIDKSKKTYIYYFLKYPYMLSGYKYFAWVPCSNFEIRLLGTTGSSPLLAYHINPYVLAVAEKIADHSIAEKSHCYSIGNNFSGLVLKNNVILYCKNDGWQVVLPENYQLEERIKQKYSITDELLLKETNDKDRVEIAEDFVKDLF
jgi:hypothetical protein